MNNSNQSGQLFIVATPMGNLQDITLRALQVLKAVDCIATEDTRHSQALLSHYQITTPVISLHAHNEASRVDALISRLLAGESVALISDAGTPLISDPGYPLVKAAHDHRIRVLPIPGPCAAIAALSASGLPTSHFIFEGFLPAKGGARLNRLKVLQTETRTLVFYEAPHRLLSCLQDLVTVLGGDREVVLAREMTKLFETIHKSTLQDLINFVKSDANQCRGEIVLVVGGLKKSTPLDDESIKQLLTLLLAELSLKKAVDVASQLSTYKKNDLYEMALTLKQTRSSS